jgi:hypothetical protein
VQIGQQYVSLDLHRMMKGRFERMRGEKALCMKEKGMTERNAQVKGAKESQPK